jgi:hypothetical protein
MTTYKTSELEGALLDAAVAKTEGFPSFWIDLGDDGREQACVLGPARAQDARFDWCPSADWSQGGPIIERERIDLWHEADADTGVSEWEAQAPGSPYMVAATPLIAAMRAYVASKLGETVELP